MLQLCFIEWEVDIENEGLYNIGMKYYNIKGKILL